MRRRGVALIQISAPDMVFVPGNCASSLVLYEIRSTVENDEEDIKCNKEKISPHVKLTRTNEQNFSHRGHDSWGVVVQSMVSPLTSLSTTHPSSKCVSQYSARFSVRNSDAVRIVRYKQVLSSV